LGRLIAPLASLLSCRLGALGRVLRVASGRLLLVSLRRRSFLLLSAILLPTLTTRLVVSRALLLFFLVSFFLVSCLLSAVSCLRYPAWLLRLPLAIHVVAASLLLPVCGVRSLTSWLLTVSSTLISSALLVARLALLVAPLTLRRCLGWLAAALSRLLVAAAALWLALLSTTC